MQKAAPTLGRMLTMVLFALSCFGLLLFLWVSFGGPIPLKPEGYRFKAAFPEAATLAEEADVRIAGVNVGKVKTKELDKGGARTVVDIEIDEKFAPIPIDTRAILRQKTLLGETYVELTPGTPGVERLPEGAELARTNVEPTTELDEFLRIFNPEGRDAFRNFVRYQAESIDAESSQDLNDALGNLPEFAGDGSDVLQVLDEQDQAVTQLIRNTGVVFSALNEREGALRELIVNSNNTFDATADEKEALAETIQVFPTFLRESRLTLDRLEEFSANTRPLVNDLKPVADDLGPTVRDLGDLAPDLEELFRELVPLIQSARTTLPDAARFLTGARPVLRALHEFLPELNPVLSYANFYQNQFSDFLTVGGNALNVKAPTVGDENLPVDRHLLSQVALLGGRSFRFNEDTRPDGNDGRAPERGNAYLDPDAYARGGGFGILESFDCETTDTGDERRRPVDTGRPGNSMGNPDTQPPCKVKQDSPYGGGLYPLVKGKIPPFGGSSDTPTPTPPDIPGVP